MAKVDVAIHHRKCRISFALVFRIYSFYTTKVFFTVASGDGRGTLAVVALFIVNATVNVSCDRRGMRSAASEAKN